MIEPIPEKPNPLSVPKVDPPTVSQFHKEEFLRMHRELTDDEWIAENKRRVDRIKRKEDKMIDTGAYEPTKHRTYN